MEIENGIHRSMIWNHSRIRNEIHWLGEFLDDLEIEDGKLSERIYQTLNQILEDLETIYHGLDNRRPPKDEAVDDSSDGTSP